MKKLFCLTALLATLSLSVFADIAPPNRSPRVSQDIFSKKLRSGGLAESRIKVRLSDSQYGDDFILLVPKTSNKSNKS